MNVVFIAPEEPSLLPSFFEKVITAMRADISAIVIVRPLYRASGWLSQARRFVRSFGPRAFLVEVAEFAYYKMLDFASRFWTTKRFYSLRRVAQHHGIRVFHPREVNDGDFLEELRVLSPDLIVSVSCPQVFGEELINVPSRGCINVHSSLLPQYRGILPTFWALAHQERRTGVTVHFIDTGIDEGRILLQEEVSISDDETLRSLMKKCKDVAADLVPRVIRELERGTVSSRPNNPVEGSYFSFPTREDVRRFRAAGRSLR